MLGSIKSLIRKKRDSLVPSSNSTPGNTPPVGDAAALAASSSSKPPTSSEHLEDVPTLSSSTPEPKDTSAGYSGTSKSSTRVNSETPPPKSKQQIFKIPTRIDPRFQNYYSELSSRYLIIEQIGEGAFSKVFRSYDTHLKKLVAIKVIDKTDLNVPQINSILKEIAIMSKLDHENVVKLYSYKNSSSSKYCFLILEHIEGGEIFNKIIKYTYFSENLARHVIRQVVKSIKYLHDEAGIVHRDIKPENLLFTPIDFIPNTPEDQLRMKRKSDDNNKLDEGKFIKNVGAAGIGTVKIADFGLSKVLWDNSTNTPCGTVGYTAPEIIKDEYYSKKVDVWAIGCVLYTLLCGFPPFYDTDQKTLAKKVSKGDYCFLSPWWDEISQDAKNLVSNLLTIDPDKRYTIDQIMEDHWFNKNYEDEIDHNLKTSSKPAADAPSSTTFDKELFFRFNNKTNENLLETLNSPKDATFSLQGDDLLTPRGEAIKLVFDTGNIIQRATSPLPNQNMSINQLTSPSLDNNIALGGFNVINEADEEDEDEASLMDTIIGGTRRRAKALPKKYETPSILTTSYTPVGATTGRRRGSSIKKKNKDELFDYESSGDDDEGDLDDSDLDDDITTELDDSEFDDDNDDDDDDDDNDDDEDDDDENSNLDDGDDGSINLNFQIKRFTPKSAKNSSLSRSPYLTRKTRKETYRLIEADLDDDSSDERDRTVSPGASNNNTSSCIKVSSSPKPASIMNKINESVEHIEDTSCDLSEKRKSSIPFITPVCSKQTTVSNPTTVTTNSTNSRCDSLSSNAYQSSRCSSIASSNHNTHYKSFATLATNSQNHNDSHSNLFNKIEEYIIDNTQALDINGNSSNASVDKFSVYPRTPHITKEDALPVLIPVNDEDDSQSPLSPGATPLGITASNLSDSMRDQQTPTPSVRPRNVKDALYRADDKEHSYSLNSSVCGDLSSTANSNFDLNLNSSTMLLRRKLKNGNDSIILGNN